MKMDVKILDVRYTSSILPATSPRLIINEAVISTGSVQRSQIRIQLLYVAILAPESRAVYSSSFHKRVSGASGIALPLLLAK